MILEVMLQLYSYGALFALGLLAGLYYFWKMGRDEHLEEISLFDAYFIALLSYFVVGRGVYSSFLSQLSLVQSVAILAHPGMSVLTGIIGALLMMGVVSSVKGWMLPKIMDLSAVSLTLVMIFGSIGTLISGVTPIAILSLFFAILAFISSYRVRKNFRFYSWYKGERSVAPEGLAAWTGVLLAGFYYVIRGFLEPQMILYMLCGGVALILLSIVKIFMQTGRKFRLPGVK